MSADAEFVFDAVVGFLTSPIWNVPVLTFIEQNCLVFDPDAENRDAYKEIHDQYKSMVETLLTSVLKDFGITEEQFMQACSRNSESNQRLSGVNREIFEQLWASEDFEVFKRLMLRKNIELQLQALHLIQQRNNVLPPSMAQGMPTPAPPPKGSQTATPDDEEAIMQEVLRKSKEEYEMQQKSCKASEAELEKSIAHSTEESERLMREAKREHEELEKALKTSLETQSKVASEAEQLRDEVKKETSKPVAKDVKKTDAKPEPAKAAPKQTTLPALKPPKSSIKKAELSSASKPGKVQASPKAGKASSPARQEKSQTSADAASSWLSSAKAEAAAAADTSSAQQTTQMTEEELARRAEYLRLQRDKLLELKKQERQKRLATYTEQQPKARPTSARAAHRVTDGQQAEPKPSQPPSQEDKEKKLAMRRALAKCLKQEVVDKHQL